MFKKIRIAVILAALALSLYQFNTGITAMNRIKQDGQTLLLQLRPVDPRALMLGDYMTLGYDSAAFPKSSQGLPAQGTVVLQLDDNNVGTFARRDDERALAEGEIRVKYALKSGSADFGSARFYFQEGTAKTYEAAKYGVFKVSSTGQMVLVDMAGEDFKVLLPDSDIAEK